MRLALTLAVLSLLVGCEGKLADSAGPVAPATGINDQEAGKNNYTEIQNQYRHIRENLDNYRKVTEDLTGFSAEGGELELYLDGDQPRAVFVTFYGETGRADEKYYFDKHGEVIFVDRQESHYNEPFGDIQSTRQHQFYFRQNKLVGWIEDGRAKVAAENPEYLHQEIEVLKFSRRILEEAQAEEKSNRGH